MSYQHVPAAFINAIAEGGSKGEALTHLQQTWNELCAVRAALQDLCDAWDYGDGGKFKGNITEAHNAAKAALSSRQPQAPRG